MKNLFSFDIKSSGQPDNGYTIKQVDAAAEEKQIDLLKKVNEFQKKYSLPVYFKIIMYICGFAAAIIVVGVLNAMIKGTSFSEGYHNAPYLYYICPVCFIIFVILFGISRYLLIKGKKDPQFLLITQEIENTVVSSFEDLGVTADAAEISVIAYFYKIKKGKEKPASPFVQFSAREMKIYADGDKLCLADISSVTAIPFSDILQIVENKKRTQFPEWTKDENYRSPKYKPYKVRAYQYGYSVKTYSMQIKTEERECEVLIPNYELETLKTFVNVPVIELKPNKKTQP